MCEEKLKTKKQKQFLERAFACALERYLVSTRQGFWYRVHRILASWETRAIVTAVNGTGSSVACKPHPSEYVCYDRGAPCLGLSSSTEELHTSP